jgi:primosomal protein N'
MSAHNVATVDVLVDESGRLGPLSYLVPSELALAAGDAVTVPFGRGQRHGLVLGPSSDPTKATREVLCRLGQRVSTPDMGLVAELADGHFASLAQVAARLSPSSGRNSAPLDAGPVALMARPRDPQFPTPVRNWARRLYLRPPLLDPARLAALEAVRLAGNGQVLVLCPTVRLLERVMAEFTSGAMRLDSKARAGAWNGWRVGSVRVGVGTRAAALYSAEQLAGIVVVEEEHPGHVESSLPYTHARDVASRRAKAHGCALTLISAAPTAAGMSDVKVLTFEGAHRAWPRVEVVDRTCLHPSLRQVPPRVTQALSGVLPVVVVAETRPARRVCQRCGDGRPCGCSGFCTHQPADACTRCGASGVRWVGWDASRIKAVLPGAEPMTLTELQSAPPADRVVVFLNVDPLLSLPSLDALPYATSSLARAAEAAGRRGSVVLVTALPQHPLLVALAARDLLPLARNVWDTARREGLPPFGRLVTVRVNWKRPPQVAHWPGRVHGPRRRAGEWEVLVQASDAELAVLRPLLESLRRRGKVRIAVT